MRSQGLRGILAVVVLVTVASPVFAAEAPKSGPLQPGTCHETEARSCQGQAPVVPPLEVQPVAQVLPPKTNPVEALLRGVGTAAGQVAGAVGAAFSSIAAAIGGALHDLARAIASLRPKKMDKTVFDAAAAAVTGTASTGVLYALRLGLARLRPLLALVPGFSRIAKDELLEHERRARMYEMIKQNPGIRLAELSRGLDLAWGTAVHHLRKLRADRLITVQKAGSHPAYFINGSGLNQQQMQAAALVQGKTVEDIAGYIETHPQTTLKELAQGLGISSPLAAFHVAKLEKAGLVHKVRDGRSVRLAAAVRLCQPTDPVTAALGRGAVPLAA